MDLRINKFLDKIDVDRSEAYKFIIFYDHHSLDYIFHVIENNIEFFPMFLNRYKKNHKKWKKDYY